VVDGGESAKELVGDVGEHGGAACGNFIFGEEEKKSSEEFVDGNGGAEFLEGGGEDGGSFRGVLLILGQLGVDGAVRGIEGSDVEAATLTVGEAMRATSGVVDRDGVSDLLGHFFFPWMRFGVHPGGNAEDFENKRVAGKAIRKTMKTKGRQITVVAPAGIEIERLSVSCGLTTNFEEKSRERAEFRTITIQLT